MPDTEQMQLPLFDSPNGDEHPLSSKPKTARKAKVHAVDEFAGVPLALELPDEALDIMPHPAPEPPPPAIHKPPPRPTSAPRIMEYPTKHKLVPTILHTPSLAVLADFAPQVVEAGDAPMVAAKLIEAVPELQANGDFGGYTEQQRASAAAMLRFLHEVVDTEPLITGLWDESEHVRLACAETLGAMGTWAEVPYDELIQMVQGLIVASRHPDPQMRIASAHALANMRAGVAVTELVERLEVEEEPDVREAVALALGELGSDEAIGAILSAYHAERLPRDAARDAIQAAGPSASEALAELS